MSDFDLWQRLLARASLGLLVDLDGTLIPFAPTPDEAQADDELRELLGALARAEGVIVAVVSGRPRAVLDEMLGAEAALRLVAEHGLWHKSAEGWAVATDVDAAVLDTVGDLLAPVVAAHEGAHLERKSGSVCIHYRGVPGSLREALIVSVTALVRQWLAAHPGFEQLSVVEAIEVRSRGVSKGAAVRGMRPEAPADMRFVALGDDSTDEDMFAALAPGDEAILVGDQQEQRTVARWHLEDHHAVRAFLRAIVDARSGAKLSAEALPQRIERASIPPRDAAARLLAISNRLPHLRDPTKPREARRRNVGGLVSALEPVLSERRGLWLGWSGRTIAGHAAGPVGRDEDASPPLAWLDLPETWEERYYNGFCNRALWPLFHAFPDRVSFADEEWQAYVQANEAFAEAASALVGKDAAVWVHDYHAMLVAAALRRRGHRGPIGFFLHTPFPSPDLFQMIPWCDALLEGLLAFDLLGFHTDGYTRNFLDCVARFTTARVRDGVVEHEHRQVHARTFALGIFPESFQEAPDPETADELAALMESLGSSRLVLGVDRLDYTKGIPERLGAFERLLELFPSWRGKVSLVQVSVPSREDVPEYAEQRQIIENAVGRINGEHGEAHWVPVRYLYRSYGRNQLSQLYRAAHVGYITPLRDGMNLVAKEFVAAQDPADPGVLVLSRFAGAAAELRDAVLTNPYHRDGMARDLERALSMDLHERRRRHAALLAVVSKTTALSWARDFVGALEALA